MPPDDLPILPFESQDEWEAWLEGNHADSPGLIECGHDTRCEVGAEQCCLRASFDFARGTTSFLEPYCAPIEAGRAACDCSVEPPSSGAPQDAGVDASIGDASQPEPDDDAG